MSLPPLPDLAVFMALVLTFSLYGLAASGHFPAEHRAPALQSGAGALILWGSVCCTALVAVFAVLLAVERLPVYATVIGGGAMLLAAPLVLQKFPDSFVDGRSGLVAFAVLGLMLVAAAKWISF